MKMCHMVADTPEELRAMAARLELNPLWIQHPGTSREHFDVCSTKASRAIRLGAVPVTPRDIVLRVRASAPARADQTKGAKA
jgi:hypothetical protein